MPKINELLEGRVVLDEVESPVNGKLTVIRDLASGVYIRGGGLPQSGGLAESIWKKTLDIVKKQIDGNIKNVLIVGLGGGSIAKLIKKNWPEADITGVDIDPVIVELGKKYMHLNEKDVEIVIEDAEKYINKQIKDNNKFDLICFDTYVQQDFPEKFVSLSFIKEVKKLLSKEGLIIFNRLYGPEDRKAANEFAADLEKVYIDVDRIYPEANIMFVCKK